MSTRSLQTIILKSSIRGGTHAKAFPWKDLLPLALDEHDYRHWLRDILARRCANNAHYSLRAFARDIGLPASRLSQVLNRRQGLSTAVAKKLVDRLKLPADRGSIFLLMVEASDSRAKSARVRARAHLEELSAKAPPLRQVDPDFLSVISSWHHFAIFELTALKTFREDILWIARRLGIEPAEASLALDRLKRLGLLVQRRGKLCRVEKDLSYGDFDFSPDIRRYTAQLVAKGAHSIESLSNDERYFSTVTLAFDSRRLAEFKQMIRKFRREVNRQGSASGVPDHVYCLTMQFFPLTQSQVTDHD